MSRPSRKPAIPRLAVGASVGYPIGEFVREALVIDDLGDLGAQGEQIVGVRVLVDDADGGDFETGASVLRLVEPPAESIDEQVRRLRRQYRAERRRARRAATA
jgi:hypothetical protein